MQEIVRNDVRPPPPVLTQEKYEYLGSEDIPVERYYSPEFFDREMKLLWPRAWQWACREEHIPEIGDYYVYEIGPYSILIVRFASGIKAYFNSCLHRSTKFRAAGGGGHFEEIRCPFHGWTWALDGALKSVPCAWDFPHVDPEKFKLPEVKVELWGGFVFINMDQNAQSLRNFMHPLQDHFEKWRFETFYTDIHIAKEMPCNWKLAQEAFIEAYHSMETHPQLMKTVIDANVQYDVFSDTVSRFYAAIGVASPMLEKQPTQNEIVRDMVMGDRSLVNDQLAVHDGETARAVMARYLRQAFSEKYQTDLSSYSDSEVIDGIEYTLFPNMFLFPGLSLPMVYRFRPIGMDPNRSLFEMLWLRPTADGGSRPEPGEPFHLGENDSFTSVPGMDQTFGHVFDQDVGNLRAQQQGLKTARKGQTLANYQEIRIRHMHRTLDKYLAET
jgi:phenylpropionate dioxygenase-like ring-hydroxylating dioxygenase large terminal subunit